MTRHQRGQKAKVVKVRAKNIQAGPIHHTTLPPMLVDRIQRLHSVFSDVYDPGGLYGWIKGFQCDSHPEKEVIIWESYARAFETFLASRPNASPNYRKEVFRTILFFGIGDDAEAEVRAFLAELRCLTDKDVLDLVNAFRNAWNSIKVETNYEQKRTAAELDYH